MRQKEDRLEDIVSELKETLKTIDQVQTNDLINGSITKLEDKIKKIRKIEKVDTIFECVLFFIIAILMAFSYLVDDRNSALTEKIENLEYRDSLFYRFMEPDSISHMFTYRIKDGEPLTYKALMHENDSIEKLNNSIKNKETEYRIKLELVQRVYPIRITEKGNYYRVHSEEIDSALILLKYFRNRITYNSEKKVWIIDIE